MRQCFYPMEQILFPFPEGQNLRLVAGRARFLQPIDLTLDVSALPVVSQPSERPDTIGGVRGGAVLAGDFLDQRGFCCT